MGEEIRTGCRVWYGRTYVENIRFIEDWKIIAKTVFAVLKREGISSDTSVTMEEFRGSKE